MSDKFEYEDRQLQCIEAKCHSMFMFEAGEQKYYADRQYDDPKRCKPCRAKRKESRRIK